MNFEIIKKIVFWTAVWIAVGVVIVFAGLAIVGCTESQRLQIDRGAQVVKPVTEAGEAALDSPAGFLVPPQYQAIIKLAGAIVLVLAGAWQELRRRTTETALAEVVAGNEADAKGASFKQAQNAVQSITTRKKVAAIRKELAA